MRVGKLFVHPNLSLLPTAIIFIAAVIALESPPPLKAQGGKNNNNNNAVNNNNNNNNNANNNNNNAGLLYGGYGVNQAVGGISIKSDGLIENASVDKLGKLGPERARQIKKAPADLSAAAGLRKISLRGLEEAIEESLQSGKPLSEEMIFLAGLEDIRYVFVYPEEKDIVLAGFGEGWQIDNRGNVVGVGTGKPVLLLDDLLTALRTAATSARGGISCSIDPTQEGIQRLRARAATLTTMNNQKAIASGLEKALGRQQVTFTGVPATSHFANVLVAADYRMKRLAMNFEPSPVEGMPSFLRMYRSTGAGMDNMLQRWCWSRAMSRCFARPMAWRGSSTARA